MEERRDNIIRDRRLVDRRKVVWPSEVEDDYSRQMRAEILRLEARAADLRHTVTTYLANRTLALRKREG